MVLTSDKCQLDGRSIALAVTLAILMSVTPHQASAKGGIKSCCLLLSFTTKAAPMSSTVQGGGKRRAVIGLSFDAVRFPR